MRQANWQLVLMCMAACGSLLGCSDSESDAKDSGASDSGSGGSKAGSGGAESDSGVATLCSKYGGPDEVAAMIPKVLGAISGDCRVNAFFAPLGADKIGHIADCMVTQVSELFGCPGFKYEGSKDTKGKVCLDMVTSHATLDISEGDFNALVDDMVAGLIEAGVSSADIMSIAPTVGSMKADIVKADSADQTRAACDGGVDAGPDGG